MNPRWTLLLTCLSVAGCVVRDWPGDDSGREPAPDHTPAGTLTGTVVDAQGAPIAGAPLTTEPGGVGTTSAADGTFRYERLLPRAYQVVVAGDGVLPAKTDPVDVTAGEETEITVTASPDTRDGVIRVKAIGPDGKPWAGARATADAGTLVVTGETDAEGKVTLIGLGGHIADVTIDDPDSRLWSRTARAVTVPTRGGADVALVMSGRPSDGAHVAGSAACVTCHADESSRFAGTAHAKALSGVTGDPAQAFLVGATLPIGAASARLENPSGTPTVTLTAADGSTSTWPVGGFIGGAVRGVIPWTERNGTAWPLPLAWIAPDSSRPGFASSGWTAGNTTAWFNASGNFAFTGTPAVAASAEARCFGCHASGFTLSSSSGAVHMTATTGSGRWDEVGISCERCHGPGSEHVASANSAKPFDVTNPGDLDADRANEVCGQCHAALDGVDGSPYPWSDTHDLFLPGDNLDDFAGSSFLAWPSGAARVPGAQLDELLASKHGTGAWSARCADCHDPHGSDVAAHDLREPADDNTLCLSCHQAMTFGSLTAAQRHTGHPIYQPAQRFAVGRCVGCHMPDTSARLAWRSETGAGDTSSHLFVALQPTVSIAGFDAAGASTLPAGAYNPNACQSCHAYGDYLFNGSFPGPTGDMSLRTTHVAMQVEATGMFP